MRTILTLVLLVSVAIPAAARAADDGWRFSLTPYLWLPTIDGRLKYDLPPGSGDPTIGVGPTDWFELLNFAALVNGSARKGRFSITSDFVYLSMSRIEDGRVIGVDDPGAASAGFGIPVGAGLTLDTSTDLDGTQWSIDVGYALFQDDRLHMDVFIGARYFSVDVSTRWSLESDVLGPGGNPILDAEGGASSDTRANTAGLTRSGRSKASCSSGNMPSIICV